MLILYTVMKRKQKINRMNAIFESKKKLQVKTKKKMTELMHILLVSRSHEARLMSQTII